MLSATLPLLLSLSLSARTLASNNGFAPTPPMGYNTYNAYSCTINSTVAQNALNNFASQGFGAAGYKIFGLDCGWQQEGMRQGNAGITYDASEFPNGINPLSSSAHNQGFLFGLYTDQGVEACDTGVYRPGSLGYESQDAQSFKNFGADYVKVDNCYVTAGNDAPKDPRTDFPSRFGAMGTALANVGIKGMLTCEWGVAYQNPQGALEGPAEWTPPISTSFRVSDDIAPGWSNVYRITNQAINVNKRGLNGPGHWSDMDLLEVGNAGMTDAEQASHFATWAMFKSPLWVSTQLDSLSSTARAVLQNKGLIAINQDSLGMPVVLTERFSLDNDQYAGPLANGDVAVLLVDQTGNSRNLGINFSALNITSATVTNLWTGQSTSGATSYFTNIQGHGSVPLRLSNVVKSTASPPTIKYIQATSGQVSNGANVQSCGGCSNGQKVGYIGNGNGNGGGTLTLSGITTSQATQDVRFDYINCEVQFGGGTNVRGASVSVNGNAPQSVVFPLSGYNWSEDVYQTYLVRLSGFKTGGAQNTIAISGLSSISQYGPDLDRIGVVA